MESTKMNHVKTKESTPAIEEIADLRSKGVSLAHIARMRGVSRQAIARTIKRHGIAPENVEAFKKGKAALLRAKQKILLYHITPERVRTMAVRDATVSFGIIYDKTRLAISKNGRHPGHFPLRLPFSNLARTCSRIKSRSNSAKTPMRLAMATRAGRKWQREDLIIIEKWRAIPDETRH